MESKDKYTLKEALEIIAKHMKGLADKPKEISVESDKKPEAEKK
jgi:hypothetical protein